MITDPLLEGWRLPALVCAGIAGVFAALYALLVLGAQTRLIG